MKYKELPAFETNEFKVGDKIKAYGEWKVVGGITFSAQGTIVSVIGDRINFKPLYLSISKLNVNFKQCRKLEEVKPREFYLNSDGTWEPENSIFIDRHKALKVREVLED